MLAAPSRYLGRHAPCHRDRCLLRRLFQGSPFTRRGLGLRDLQLHRWANSAQRSAASVPQMRCNVPGQASPARVLGAPELSRRPPSRSELDRVFERPRHSLFDGVFRAVTAAERVIVCSPLPSRVGVDYPTPAAVRGRPENRLNALGVEPERFRPLGTFGIMMNLDRGGALAGESARYLGLVGIGDGRDSRFGLIHVAIGTFSRSG